MSTRPEPSVQRTVIGRLMSLPVASSSSRACSFSERGPAFFFALRAASSCLRIGFSGPLRTVSETPPSKSSRFRIAAELGVALLEGREVGGPVVEGAERAADVGQGQAGEHLAVVDLLGRERDRHGEHDALDAVRRAVSQNDVPPRVEMIFGGFVGMRPQRNLRRLLPDHVEVGQVGVEVADQEVVDVVLARVDAGGEARPRRRRLGGLRRSRAARRRPRPRASSGSAACPRPCTGGPGSGPCRRSR